MSRLWQHVAVLIVVISGGLVGYGFWRLLNHPSINAMWTPAGDVYWVEPESEASLVLQPRDRLLEIDRWSPNSVWMMLPNREVGDVVSLQVQRGDITFPAELPVVKTTWTMVSRDIAAWVLAIMFWGFGWLLVRRAHTLSQSVAAGAAGAFFSFAGVMFALGAIGSFGPPWVQRLFSIGLWLVAPLGTLLHLWFPRPLAAGRSRYVVLALALGGLVGAVWNVTSPTDYIGSVNYLAHMGGYAWLVSHLVISVLLLAYRWFRSPSLEDRRQLGILVGGGAFAMIPMVMLSLIPLLAVGSAAEGLGLEAMPLLLLPASYSYAFLRYRRMAQDRDQLVARLIVYAFTATCMGFLIALGFALPGIHTLPRESLAMVAILIGALASGPFTRWIEAGLGRLIFGQLHDPLQQAARTTDAIDLSIEQDDLSEQVAAILRQQLDIEQSVVLVLDVFSVLVDASKRGLAGAASGVPVYRGSKLEGLLLGATRVLEFEEIATQLTGTNAAPLLQVPWARALVPLTSRGVIVGVLLISYRTGTTFLSTQDLTVLKLVAQSLATAIQRRSLVRILQDKSAEAAMLTQEILRIRNEERKRIARDLHDDIIQPMIATSYSVAMFEDANAPQVRQRLLDLIELTRNICFELRQPALDTLGFGAAARTAVHDFRSRSHLDATIAIDEAPGIVVPEHVAAAALGILGEALQNADKHAEATSVTVNVVVHPDHLKVRVKDDGRGFDPTEAQARAARTKHFGLQTMSERVAGAGGQYNVTSAPGQGACVEAIFPLTPPAGD